MATRGSRDSRLGTGLRRVWCISVSVLRRILRHPPLLRGGRNRRGLPDARCPRPLCRRGSSVTKSNLLGGCALLGRGGCAPVLCCGGSFTRGLLGGFDPGALLFLGYAVERQLKPLQWRAVVCELSATLLVAQREPPLLARHIASRCAGAAPIGRILRRRASGRGGTSAVTRRCSVALPVGGRETGVFWIHRGKSQRPVRSSS